MILPDAVRTALDDEPVLDRLPLGGEDELFVTPTRLVRYRAEGLFSDESVEGFSYGAERVSISEGRRTTEITLAYVDDDRSLSVPADRFETVLGPLLAGILSASGVTADEEEAIEAFRFDELTVIVTDRRVVEHVGTAVWDGEYEELRLEDVTGLTVERGRVATEIVISTGDRSKRIKIRNDRAGPFEACVRTAIREHHGVNSIDELADEEGDPDANDVPPIEGVDPLSIARAVEDPTANGARGPPPEPNGGDEPGPEAGGDRRPDTDMEAELERLANAIEEQETLLAQQRCAIDRLREELAITPGRDR